MNQNDYDSLLASLNEAVAILARIRTPDPRSVAAYDTLKQARAMVLGTIDPTHLAQPVVPAELAA